MSVLPEDSFSARFCPQSWKKWSFDLTGEAKFWWCGVPATKFCIDRTTGYVYLNEEPCLIRIKCAVVAVLTPLLHAIFIIVNVIFRLIKIVSFYSFWRDSNSEEELTLQQRVQEWQDDGLRVLLAPAVLLFLELAALYGALNFYQPNDGKKIYYNIELSFYGTGILGECFQFAPVNRVAPILGSGTEGPG